jgi:hypothetical protein
MLALAAVHAQGLLAGAAQSRAHIAESVMIAADYFHARSIAAVTTAQGKFQLRIDKALERRVIGEFAAVGSALSKARLILSRITVASLAAGSEPRVPQKRTRMATPRSLIYAS